MRTCSKCGTENADTATICAKCTSPLQQSGTKTCPSGRHTMDATWTECVYCKQENIAPSPAYTPPKRVPTMFEGQLPLHGGPNRAATEKEPTHIQRHETELQSGEAVAGDVPALPGQSGRARANTVFRPSTTPSVNSGRRIVGLLISYSWNPEGEIFPIRVGRNRIGRDPECEVCISNDQTMSGHNSHITFRQNFVVGDMVSMMGTDVDGVPIEEQFRSLANYSTIRAGSTYFTFIAIAPQKPDV